MQTFPRVNAPGVTRGDSSRIHPSTWFPLLSTPIFSQFYAHACSVISCGFDHFC